ncbi:MAG: SLBB domain-containing protein [candidate division WOR-3 bacterium]|nr:SLBB domain-containing protein [candidate division WOR-3 bacterium]
MGLAIIYSRFSYPVLTILFTFTILYSQQGTTAGSPGLEKPIVSEEYILMPGDKILITITGGTNYSYTTDVTYEGKITINLPVASLPTAQGVYIPHYDIVAAVPVYNLDLKMAKDSLSKVFSKYYRNINVDITLIGMRNFIVFLAGEVKNPGSIVAYPIERVSEVIKKAGGTTTIGSRTKIELRRKGKLYRIVNLEKFERFGETDQNPFVQDGDLIYVPKMEKSVIVRGAVFGKMGYELKVSQLTAAMERTSEGLYELNPGDRISDLISKAGGVTPWADLQNCYVMRSEKKIEINLHEILTNINTESNIELEDGDIIVIPPLNAVVYVQGQVVNPGAFPFQPNLRASDYIGLAGGPLSEANISGAYIVRKGKRLSIKKDPVVLEGDRIVVPRQVFKFWQDYVEIGSVVASLILNYLTLMSLTK